MRMFSTSTLRTKPLPSPREVARRPLASLLAASLLTTSLLAGASAFTAPPAAAEPQEGIGLETRPGQPYGGQERARDWLGSYLLGGDQAWCVQFALTAPDSGEEYRPGEELRTKWGDPLPDDVAADISYLLLRYGETTEPDQAAALAHLLHSWTAAPRDEADLDPGKDFTQIAYDVHGHFAKLSAGAQAAVEDMRAEAAANRGPWQAELTAPDDEQTIGEPGTWKLAVRGSDDAGIGDVPVALTATDAEITGVGEGTEVRTPADGSPLELEVTPTGPEPRIEGTLSAPADRPYVREAVQAPDTTQRVVSTGGEQELAVQAAASAVTAPGAVHVGKFDSQSDAGIEDTRLRISAPDGSPALRQDGGELLDSDGEPLVVTTGRDGTVELGDLRTPQEIKIVEVTPAPGYEEAFDEAAPPETTGVVQPGSTLRLRLDNAPNTPTVPIRIPAGGPEAAGTGGGVPALGVLALTSAATAGWALRRYAAGER